MSWEGWFALGIVILLVVVLVTERVPPPVAVLGAVITLLVANVITPEEAFSGFANAAPIAVAALYVLAAGVEKTGALERITARLLGTGARAQMSDRMALAGILVPTAAASAFLNNTPIRSGDRHRASSSFLTPIGYQTNTMVYGMGGYRLGDFARVGAPLTALVFVVTILFIPMWWPLS